MTDVPLEDKVPAEAAVVSPAYVEDGGRRQGVVLCCSFVVISWEFMVTSGRCVISWYRWPMVGVGPK